MSKSASHSAGHSPGKLAELLRRMERFTDRSWYPALVAALAALDLFVLVIPTDGLLISAVLSPKRRAKWVSAAIWVSLGSTVGAVLLASLVQGVGDPFLRWIAGSALNGEAWERVRRF